MRFSFKCTDGADPYNPKKYILATNSTEIGRERNGMNPNVPHIQVTYHKWLALNSRSIYGKHKCFNHSFRLNLKPICLLRL